jgi:hypothetical protein
MAPEFVRCHRAEILLVLGEGVGSCRGPGGPGVEIGAQRQVRFRFVERRQDAVDKRFVNQLRDSEVNQKLGSSLLLRWPSRRRSF